MFESIPITYEEALLLKHRDICVFDPSSGQMSTFDDLEWNYMGRKTTPEEILKETGSGFIDDHLEFIWLRYRKI